ncbi:siderophore-interacting protein [Streptomyces sp. AJS327]|uniref:siderophore-interacting protein n=1 Tax=Streptomyces sp. AJS327 TaxID=2545265 RepID=UPI0015E01373|nr:siderophore-interacting protein [Streptomyces sp. AJS327]MBA0050951.1 siderophore-interacting protein [Streptomyces sp. AJS327]
MAGREHRAFPIYIRELEVLEVFDVTPLTRRVVLTGEQLGAFRNNGYAIEPFRTENADDHVKIVITDGPGVPEGTPPVAPPVQDDGHLDWTREAIGRSRDYTPRRYDPERRRLELDFVRHRGGIAAEWAERVAPGQRVHVAGPRGTTVLPDGIDWYFLVGDETALPAIARRIEELPAGTPVTAVVSVPTASEEQTLDHATDLHLTWVHRDTAGPDGLMDAVRAAPWRDGRVYAWAAGEAGTLRPLRRWFRQDRGVDPGFTDVAGYWRAGQTQEEMGLALHTLRRKTGLGVPHAIRAALTLDLAEHVTDGHRTIAALAEAAEVTQGGLRRLLRVLEQEGFCTLGGKAGAAETVELTPFGAVLLEETAHSGLDRRNGYSRLDDAWPGIVHTLRTGTSGFTHVRGHDFWAELATEERLGRTFDEVLGHWTEMWSPRAVEALDLTDEHVMDVGGGTGTLLGRVLTAYPHTSGTLLDLPTTAERGRAELAGRGLAERVRIVGRSFFEALPEDADVYVLAQVLHDWPDAEATAILRRVAAAADDRRVVLFERISGDHDDAQDIVFDLQMHTVFASGERTEADWAELARGAGLRLTGTTRVRENFFMIELRAA